MLYTMQQIILLPPCRPGVSEALQKTAIEAALARYNLIIGRATPVQMPPMPNVVSTEYVQDRAQIQGTRVAHELEHAGYVKLGRCRCLDGYTTMYAHESVAAQYASPTAAYREFIQCVKS